MRTFTVSKTLSYLQSHHFRMRQSNPNFTCWHLQKGACQETVQALVLNSNRHMKIVSLLSSNYVQEAQYSNFQM